MSKDTQEFIPFRRSGSPVEYSSGMCQTVVNVAKAGGFEAAMCVALNISPTTFRSYQEKYPEFKEAVEFANTIILAMQEKNLQDGIVGKTEGKYNFSANAYVLNNKYKQLYSSASGSNNTEITINQINLSPEQITAKIAQKLEKLQTMGIVVKPEDVTIPSIEEENDGN